MGKFVSRILGSADVVWTQTFEQAGQRYRKPTLVMFSGATRADACGAAQSAMGPFYCPPDQKIYLDTSFFRDLERRFRGCDAGSRSCQFAQAYVIAHEVGHHVQNQLGILSKVQQQQKQVGKTEANQLQVRVELQADCLAGVWAAKSDQQWKFIEPGEADARDALRAPSRDDACRNSAGLCHAIRSPLLLSARPEIYLTRHSSAIWSALAAASGSRSCHSRRPM